MTDIICDPKTGYAIEKGWEISRQFMKEIEEELKAEFPPNLLLISSELKKKFIDWASKN
jgi:hypothetical protein